PVAIGHCAFVAGAVRYEDARGALDLFDRTVDPGAIELVAIAVDREASFAVIESAEHDIGPSIYAHAEVVYDVAIEVVNVDLRVNVFRSARRDFGFELAGVAFAVEHGA